MSPFRLDEALAVLDRTPAVCGAWLDGLPDGWLSARETPTSWSPKEIVAHLIDGERTDWVPRARIILEHGEARPFDPFERTGHEEDAARMGVSDLLRVFRDERERNLRTVRAWQLTGDQLQRTGMHPALGRVTLQHLLGTWVVHDLAHIKQMARTMAKRYRDAVGPWNQADYLRILQEN